MDLCKQQRLRPLPVISVTLPHSLDFATDRVKMDDWGPILNSLSLDRTLRSISVRSRYQCRKPLEEVNSEDKARAIGKAPVVLTRFLLEWLSHSVAQCLRNSPALTCLELEGIPLPPDCLAVLCVGLASTNTLKHFSLQRCRIGDGSCELICRTVADVQSIRSLNLSQCDLSFQSGPILATALSRQKLTLYHDTWIDSLRYREPNFEAMPGLRRLTLNGNPQLGDFAVGEIIEAIRDSLWLKAIDLQNCGLTDNVAYQISDLLNNNVTLSVVDLRLNAIEEQLLSEISDKLLANNPNEHPEYRWMSLPQRGKPATVNQRRENGSRGFPAKNVLLRSRSAVGRQPKRPCRQVAPLRASTAQPTRDGRPEMKQTCPSSNLRKPVESESTKIVEKPPARVSLRICLPPNTGAVEDGDNVSEDIVGENQENTSINAKASKVEEVVRQLTEARARYEQLVEETRRNDSLLVEEKSRREMAEAKLRSMNENLADLEAALKAKEEETRGFVLISQQALDDICTTFDRLLEMLDSVTRNPGTLHRDVDEELVARETIKRHLAHLIRKTKSESLSRTIFPGSPAAENLWNDVARKSTRSENDLRTSVPQNSGPIHLEKNIGDRPDVMSPSRETNHLHEAKQFDSPEQRARAIFAQIVRDGSILTIGSHIG